MRIAIFGLGYVGTVCASCLAREGHSVIGVDLNPQKVSLINRGQSPIMEPGLSSILAEQVRSGRLKATDSPSAALQSSELTFVCVGTPSSSNGSVDLSSIHRVTTDLASYLKTTNSHPILAYRSTLPPGTMEGTVIPLLSRTSRKNPGHAFSVAYNPEFLREGSSIADFYSPPRLVLAATDSIALTRLSELYAFLPLTPTVTSFKTAETIKYIDNAFHSLKIAFANEAGRLATRLGIDSSELLHLFSQETKLNISSAYLKPGFAFGGSCLPKDLRALVRIARDNDVSTPVLAAILHSNTVHIQAAADFIYKSRPTGVGIFGIAFKPGTDDLRESPSVALAELLLAKGIPTRIFDPSVNLSSLHGANMAFLLEHLPHISRLLVHHPQDIFSADLIVLAHPADAIRDIIYKSAADKIILDLVHTLSSPYPAGATYVRIS